jgi:hypothetical protein
MTFVKILKFVDEANCWLRNYFTSIEGQTDRHNMLLFLLQDTLKDKPVGFENDRRNLFDPEDDFNKGEDDDDDNLDIHEDLNGKNESMVIKHRQAGIHETGEGEDECRTDTFVCARKGCLKKPRFDSMFCSDACGVSALESDLLRTFNYVSDIHPSTFRH